MAAATWDGGGGDNKWMTAVNWAGDIAPSPGAHLIFPGGALQTSNVNDFAPNTAFGSILITGNNYSLTGNQILGSSVTSQGTGNSLGLSLKLAANGGLANNSNSTFTVTGTIDLNGFNLGLLNANSSGVTVRNGAISGAGNLNANGNGTTALGVANSYLGVTTVNGGTLTVRDSLGLGFADGSAASGTVTNGGVLQLENAITVSNERLSNGVGNTLLVRSAGTAGWTGAMTSSQHVTL